MSNAGIFLYGFLVTLVICAAFAVLAYGILLDKRDLESERREEETVREEQDAARVIEFPARPGDDRQADAPAAQPQPEPAARSGAEPLRESGAAA